MLATTLSFAKIKLFIYTENHLTLHENFPK